MWVQKNLSPDTSPKYPIKCWVTKRGKKNRRKKLRGKKLDLKKKILRIKSFWSITFSVKHFKSKKIVV